MLISALSVFMLAFRLPIVHGSPGIPVYIEGVDSSALDTNQTEASLVVSVWRTTIAHCTCGSGFIY